MPRHYDDSDEDLYENPYADSDTDADDDDVDVVENPASVVRTARDERLWRMAKASAAKQGRARDWPYVMGIFQHMKQRTGSEPAENPRHDVVSVEVMGRMIVCDVVDMFEGPPRSLPDYAGALVIAKVPEEFSSQAYREGGPYVVGFLLRDGAVFSPTFRPTMAAALRHVEQMPWEQGYSVQHNPDDEDAPPPAPPSFQLRASAVQQGLFAPSSYEAKPQKKKPAAPVDTRQRDLFGLPIDGDDEPRENPEPRILRFESRAEANRWMREHDVLGRAHESYPDGWIIVFSQKGRIFAVASPEEGVYEGVWLQDW